MRSAAGDVIFASLVDTNRNCRFAHELRKPVVRVAPLHKGCELGFEEACRNLVTLAAGKATFSGPAPDLADFPIILSRKKGRNSRCESTVLVRACRQKWPNTCERS